MIQRNLIGADRPRSAPRHKIFLPTQVYLSTGETRAHLINVSSSGALVHATTTPHCEETIQVALCGALIPARVRWVDGRRFGLSFLQPLGDAQIKQLIGEV